MSSRFRQEVDSDAVEDVEDADNDGYTIEEGDCDDENAAINPEATDVVGDDVDQNCDGTDGFDGDADGMASLASGGTDCDDEDPDSTGTDVDADCDSVLTDDDCDDNDATQRSWRMTPIVTPFPPGTTVTTPS